MDPGKGVLETSAQQQPSQQQAGNSSVAPNKIPPPELHAQHPAYHGNWNIAMPHLMPHPHLGGTLYHSQSLDLSHPPLSLPPHQTIPVHGRLPPHPSTYEIDPLYSQQLHQIPVTNVVHGHNPHHIFAPQNQIPQLLAHHYSANNSMYNPPIEQPRQQIHHQAPVHAPQFLEERTAAHPPNPHGTHQNHHAAAYSDTHGHHHHRVAGGNWNVNPRDFESKFPPNVPSYGHYHPYPLGVHPHNPGWTGSPAHSPPPANYPVYAAPIHSIVEANRMTTNGPQGIHSPRSPGLYHGMPLDEVELYRRRREMALQQQHTELNQQQRNEYGLSKPDDTKPQHAK